MATALHPLRNDTGPVTLYPRALMTDLDFKDNRYPSLSSQPENSRRASAMLFGSSDLSGWESSTHTNDGPTSRKSFDPAGHNNTLNTGWEPEARGQSEALYQPQSGGVDVQSLRSQSQQSQSQEPQRSTLSYILPPGAARRVVERYSLDDNVQRAPSRASGETRPTAIDSTQDRSRSGTPQPARQSPLERPASILPASPRNSILPITSVGAGPSKPNGGNSSPIIPVSASPAYSPPIAPKHRAYPQQPTYITPPATPTPIHTVYSPRPPQPQDEVCVECAMRDQDMADVDVTSPGIWDRESDVVFEELKRRELEDEASGLVTIDDPKRPRVKGGRLTEQNLKIWLSINPREPASRQQTLNTYVKSQRALLEAEALARLRAMQEARQLDNRMRDTYSQLRRSAYDMGSSAAPADDTGGVRIKPPLSSASPAHARSHSREITLLENGMIVEHVDVRKEEKEARERKRKEERRARKSSRSSGIDVTSIISAQSYGSPLTDSGMGLKPNSRYSQASSARPTSILTAPHERPDLPRAYSQASFSDVHSLGSASPRRSRFFGMRNFSAGWRSQDSLAASGMSGSMIDMHVALQRERGQAYAQSPVDLNTPRRSQIWPPVELEATGTSQDPLSEDKPKKKKNGLAKIWRIVTGSAKQDGITSREVSRSYERTEDDLPLAPPPPLSYLVDRGPGDLRVANGRHASTPSLPSVTSPKITLPSLGMLPSTAPSSIAPSLGSLRPSGPDLEMTETRNFSGNHDDQDLQQQQHQDDTISKGQNPGTRIVHPVTSEPDIRQRISQNEPVEPLPNPVKSHMKPSYLSSRDKSLPPLPGEPGGRNLASAGEPRPQTVFTYNPQHPPTGSGPAQDLLPPSAPFRTPDVRRQSFGGLTTRPNLVGQSMPAKLKQAGGYDPSRSFGSRYDEFGTSRRSLGRLNVQEHLSVHKTPAASTKRKSKFGFGSLLGKKQAPHDTKVMNENVVHRFPSMRLPESDSQDEFTTNNVTSNSRHTTGMGAPHTRMSVTSRKALEERVAQDPEFVAYRYPSNDQRIDLLR